MWGPGTTQYWSVGRRPSNQGWPVSSGSAGNYSVSGVWSGERGVLNGEWGVG